VIQRASTRPNESDVGGSAPRAAAIYLSVVQFFFATMWTIYVIFLPALAQSVGIPREAITWILVLDQAIFTLTDFLMGFAADSVARAIGRIGPSIAGVTALACALFVAMPSAAGTGSPVLFVVVLVIWAATSSALRAPPWVLLSRYAATPSLPALAALGMVGVSIGGASAPYLGVLLRGADPRLPFALSSVTLAATTGGLVWVERALSHQVPGAAEADNRSSVAAVHVARAINPTTRVLLTGGALVALGIQAHISFNSTAEYLRYASAQDLDYLLPIFWVGFNLFMFPASAVTPRLGSGLVLASAAGLGTLGLLVAAIAPNLALTIAGHVVAGGAWGSVLMAGLSTAISLGRTGREGVLSGLWFSTQSLAAFVRILVVAAHVDQQSGFTALAAWAPGALWFGGTCVFLSLLWRYRERTLAVPWTGEAATPT